MDKTKHITAFAYPFFELMRFYTRCNDENGILILKNKSNIDIASKKGAV